MPTPFYDNAYVQNREKKNRLGVRVEPNVPDLGAYVPDSGPSQDEIVREAQASLQSANNFANSAYPSIEAAGQDAMQETDQDSPSVFDSQMTRLGRLGRNIVRPIPQAADKAAILGSVLGGPAAPVFNTYLGLRGGQAIAEGGMERIQEHPVMTGIDAAMMLPVLRGLRGLRGAGKVAEASKPLEAVQGAEMFTDAARRSGGRIPWKPGMTPIDTPSLEALRGLKK